MGTKRKQMLVVGVLIGLVIITQSGATQPGGQDNCLGCDEACCGWYTAGYTQCSMDVTAPGCGSWCTNGETECPESRDDDLVAGIDGVASFSAKAEKRGFAENLRDAGSDFLEVRHLTTCAGVLIGRDYATHASRHLRRITREITI